MPKPSSSKAATVSDPYLALLPRLTHPFAKELCWLLSPSTHLLKALAPYKEFRTPQFSPAVKNWLEGIHTHNLSQIRSKSSRLGVAFEHLMQSALEHCPSQEYRLLEHGFALREAQGKGKVTLGELDFVVSKLSPAPMNIHLEVAVKYYLGTYHAGHLQWLGPNANDSLQRKCAHLKTHQLPMSTHAQCQNLDIEERQFLMKGGLFRHWKEGCQTPNDVHSAMTQNLWMHYHELETFLSQTKEHWIRLNRREWLTGIPAQPFSNALDACLEQAHKPIAQQYPIMLSADPAYGLRRTMVVNNHWPNTTST